MSRILKIKNHAKESQLFTRRTLSCFIIAVVLSLILILRLGYLQLRQNEVYSTLSQKNLMDITPIEPNRGLIYDRNGVLLAENIPAYNLAIIPERIHDLKATIKALKPLVHIRSTDIQNFKHNLKRYHPYEPVPLKLKLDEEERASFYVNQYKFPGVVVVVKMLRHYPFNELTSHVVGYVGRINPKELAQVDPVNYSGSDYIGKTGVEKYYENILHGTVGSEEVETDASGKVVRILKRRPPIPGTNIYLSLDSQLQSVAQNALNGESGAVVAIDPQNGEIIALVTNPSYNPNLFVAGVSQKDYQELLNSSERPLYNRAIRGQFAAGSTIKPFLAINALNLGIIDINFKVVDHGIFQLPHIAHIYHDWRKGGHGVVNVVDAITMSCDIFFYTLAVKVGIHQIDDILNAFGFGKATGIDMPDELGGIVPSPEWKQKVTGQPWYPGDTVNTGIGQGAVLVTPLQLAAATATLANRGLRYQPHLLHKSQDPIYGTVIKPAVALPPVILKEPGTWDIVFQGMQQVLRSQHGTAWLIGHNMPYTAAAKTGTAQVYGRDSKITDDMVKKRLRNNHLFISFAPVENPKIAISVIVEHVNTATKVAREVLDYYLVTEHHLEPEAPNNTEPKEKNGQTL